MKIEIATLKDWPEIEQIYRAGIRTKNATFTTEADVGDGASWFAGKVPELVFKAVSESKDGDEDGTMLGWACVSPISSRAVYSGVGEDSVYVSESARGRGVGSALLGHLIAQSEQAQFWTLQASMFPENPATIHLHKKHGFRIVGTREKISQLDGIWRDTVFMERRSQKIDTLLA